MITNVNHVFKREGRRNGRRKEEKGRRSGGITIVSIINSN